MGRGGASLDYEIDGQTVHLTNLDKVFYPSTGFRKADVIEYYALIAPVLLPHLRDRPLTLKRYPDGVEGGFFYQKDCPSPRPSWITTAPVYSEQKGRDTAYCVCNDLASLLWLANLADLEFHTVLSRLPRLERPTVVAFDLDPGAPADILDCCDVAMVLRHLLDDRGLDCYPKTSGSKGLQLYVPLNTPATFDQTKAFALMLAQALEARHPGRVTSNMRKDLRRGRVLIDWSQNVDHKTTVAPYSLRARASPTVSTPLRWDEVEDAVKGRHRLGFEADAVVDRVESEGDLFRPVLTRKQRLPPVDKKTKRD